MSETYITCKNLQPLIHDIYSSPCHPFAFLLSYPHSVSFPFSKFLLIYLLSPLVMTFSSILLHNQEIEPSNA
mgnify:FL=1